VRGYTFARGGTFSESETSRGAPVCILGETVRRELFAHQDALGAALRLGGVSCAVVGVLKPKGRSSLGLDQDDMVVIPLSTFQRCLAGNTDVSAIFVSAVTDRETPRAIRQLQALMRERRHVRPGNADDFAVEDMKELARTLGSVTGALTGLLGAPDFACLTLRPSFPRVLSGSSVNNRLGDLNPWGSAVV